MVGRVNTNALTYQALDQVLGDGFVSPTARRAMFIVVDCLRDRRGSADVLRCAERISVEIHKLECAGRTNDTSAKASSLRQLKSLAIEWLNTRITG